MRLPTNPVSVTDLLPTGRSAHRTVTLSGMGWVR